MRAHKFTLRRRLADYLSPRLFPGKHRFCVLLDTPHLSCVTDKARFDAMPAHMYPQGETA